MTTMVVTPEAPETPRELMTAITERDIAELKHQYDLFRKLQKDVLEENVDYGYPAGKRNGSKPSLYKSGAEKLTRLFNLVPEFEIIQAIERDDFIMYKFRCRLKTQSGVVIGDGFGACNSKEKAGWDEDPWKYQNNIMKMAKKRAHVDAVLTGVGASNVFTQDIEDMDEVPETYARPQKKIERHSDMRYKIRDAARKKALELKVPVEEIYEQIKDRLRFVYGVEEVKDLDSEDQQELLEWVESLQKEEQPLIGDTESEEVDPSVFELLERLKALAEGDEKRQKALDAYLAFYPDWRENKDHARDLRDSLKSLHEEWTK